MMFANVNSYGNNGITYFLCSLTLTSVSVNVPLCLYLGLVLTINNLHSVFITSIVTHHISIGLHAS